MKPSEIVVYSVFFDGLNDANAPRLKGENFDALKSVLAETANKFQYDLFIDAKNHYPRTVDFKKKDGFEEYRIYVHVFSSPEKIAAAAESFGVTEPVVYFKKKEYKLSGFQRDFIKFHVPGSLQVLTDSTDPAGNKIEQVCLATQISNHIYINIDLLDMRDGDWATLPLGDDQEAEGFDLFSEILNSILDHIFKNKIVPSRDQIVLRDAEIAEKDFEKALSVLSEGEAESLKVERRELLTSIEGREKALKDLFDRKLEIEDSLTNINEILSKNIAQTRMVYGGLIRSYFDYIRFEGETIKAMTKPIFAPNKNGDKIYRVGQLEVIFSIKRFKETLDVRSAVTVKNIESKPVGGRTSVHPHAYENGTLCFGSVLETAVLCAKRSKFVDLFQCITMILFTINHNSTLCALEHFEDVTDYVDQKYLKFECDRALVEETITKRKRS